MPNAAEYTLPPTPKQVDYANAIAQRLGNGPDQGGGRHHGSGLGRPSALMATKVKTPSVTLWACSASRRRRP